MSEFSNITMSNERIVLDNDEPMHCLGPELVLNQCDLESDCSSRGLLIAGLTMNGGTFNQRRKLQNYPFARARFHDVAFLGSYVGCDFGEWGDGAQTLLSACDFSQAKLDGCRFLNCDGQQIKFPKWPCFTMRQPDQARDYVKSREWPAMIGQMLNIYTDMDAQCVAICGDAKSIADKTGAVPDELRQLLEDIPGILIID